MKSVPAEVALDAASALTRTLERTERAGAALRAMPPAEIVRVVAAAARTLGDDSTPLGRQALATIPTRAALSPEGVRWGLETSLAELAPAALERGLSSLEALRACAALTPVRLGGVVLAGNVFSACLRPIAWALLCRVPVVVKVASTDAGLAELFALALTLEHEDVGAAVGIARFSRSEPELLARLASAVDVLGVHGSDRTIEEARVRCSATTELVAHGHGLGMIFVPREALGADADVASLVASLALDVAAYDQRGCLSPHAILVEGGAAVSGRELARRLSEEGLRALATSMPRGPLATLEGAVQVRWRGVAQALGELFEGDGWAVSFEGGGPIRACPLHRNVAVHEVASSDEALARIAGYGAHLKALGVAAPTAARHTLAERLPPGLAPRVSAVGAMQRPPFEAPTDGVPPWQGLLRLTARD